jgi:hypothetical protein
MQETIRFHNPKAFSGLTGQVDAANAVIRGVSCITGELEAEGHSLYVDDTTLTQLHSLAKTMDQVPVTLNHDGGIQDVNGYLTDFRKEGNKIRADWHLLQAHKETPIMLERAQRQPSTFGLSFAFKGDPKGVLCNGRKCARAEQLMSCDVVKRAAANPDGLFSAKEASTLERIEKMMIKLSRGEIVDTTKNGMTTATNEPTLADVLAAVSALTAEVGQMKAVQDQLVDSSNREVDGRDNPEQIRATLEALFTMSDADLAAYCEQTGQNISRDEINEAVADFNATYASEGQGEVEGEYTGQSEVATPEGGAGAGAGEAAMAGAGAGAGSVGLAALERRVIALQSKMTAQERAAARKAEAIQFSELESNMAELARQRDEARQIALSAASEVEALRMHVRTGTRPVKVGVDDGVRLFAANDNGELHPFQKLMKQMIEQKKCTEGQAIRFAMKEPNGIALHADWLQSGGTKRITLGE